MLFRRVLDHVRSQNWLAVGVDFVIVVVGVFIGIQVSNWNQSRQHAAAFDEALDRLQDEIAHNLEVIDQVAAESTRKNALVAKGFAALESCSDDAETRAAVEAALHEMTYTLGIGLRTDALQDQLDEPTYLARQSREFRALLTASAHNIEQFLAEAKFAERRPLDRSISEQETIRVLAPVIRNFTYLGQDFSLERRELGLAVPVSEACQSQALIKEIYAFENWQGTVPVSARILRTEIEGIDAALTAFRESRR